MIEHMLIFLNLLAMGILVGKIVFLSFVTAPVLSRTLDSESFSRVIRSLFPPYYGLGMISATIGWTSSIALGLLNNYESLMLIPATLWLGILAIEFYCRTPLIGQINELSDELKMKEAKGLNTPLLRERRDGLHRLSLQLNSIVLLMGLCLIGLSGVSL